MIDDIFDKGNGIGKILGYSYTGPHRCTLSLCDVYYTIRFSIIKNDQEYNTMMTDDILTTQEKFQKVLGKE
jgi:hypothetical protein